MVGQTDGIDDDGAGPGFFFNCFEDLAYASSGDSFIAEVFAVMLLIFSFKLLI